MAAHNTAPPPSSTSDTGILHPEFPRPTGDPQAHRYAWIEYRWRRARADYLIGCRSGVIHPGADGNEIIARIYAAYVIADAQEGR